jgi:hypothetical protein
MKAYGVPRKHAPGRKIRGTSRDCPCCGSIKGHKCNRKSQRKRARSQETEE